MEYGATSQKADFLVGTQALFFLPPRRALLMGLRRAGSGSLDIRPSKSLRISSQNDAPTATGERVSSCPY
jgi:hypothetical protein